MKTVIGIDEAPRAVTMTGAIPVTRIVPARPITKAPHQFVSRLRSAEAYCSSSEADVCLESGAMDLPPPLAVSPRRRWATTLPGNKVARQSKKNSVGCARLGCAFLGRARTNAGV